MFPWDGENDDFLQACVNMLVQARVVMRKLLAGLVFRVDMQEEDFEKSVVKHTFFFRKWLRVTDYTRDASTYVSSEGNQ